MPRRRQRARVNEGCAFSSRRAGMFEAVLLCFRWVPTRYLYLLSAYMLLGNVGLH